MVEDNADIRDYIADSFTDLYEVKTAANGKEGLQIATECIPDIVVSDIMMPVMNGIMMCQKLKADMRTSHIPVILLTAKDSITDKEEGYQAGADSYLTKPFSASLLQSRISNLLTQRRLLSERFAIRPEKPENKVWRKKSHYYRIYEQTGQGIHGQDYECHHRKPSHLRKRRYYRTFQCDVHEQFYPLSQGKSTYRYVHQ